MLASADALPVRSRGRLVLGCCGAGLQVSYSSLDPARGESLSPETLIPESLNPESLLWCAAGYPTMQRLRDTYRLGTQSASTRVLLLEPFVAIINGEHSHRLRSFI